MSNPFTTHGIDHLSPSSINTFAASPALWVMERLLKRPAPVGAPAHRGKAAEAGIVDGLIHPKMEIEDCVELALKNYRSMTALCGDPRREKEGAALPGIVCNGIAELRPYGVPTKTQGKVEHKFEGVCVPVLGYYDLLWENHGIVLDIKTQLKLNSSIKSGHARQVALYKVAAGDNLDARISYISDKKAATYHLDNFRDHLNALRMIALTMQRFLAISRDPKELAGLVVPDTDSFYFNNPIARQRAFEIYGF